MKHFLGASLVLAGALTWAVGSASADTIYTIDNPGGGTLSCCPSPYATVTVTLQDATHASVNFLTSGPGQYLMGGTAAADMNVNAASWTAVLSTAGALTGFSSNFPSDITSGGSGNVNGFGTFNQTFNNFDGYTHAWYQLIFNLTNTSGTWANSDAVLTNNANGFAVAIHGFACSGVCNITTGAIATGFATTGGSSVPEPASLLLLGAGLAGIGISRRDKKVLA